MKRTLLALSVLLAAASSRAQPQAPAPEAKADETAAMKEASKVVASRGIELDDAAGSALAAAQAAVSAPAKDAAAKKAAMEKFNDAVVTQYGPALGRFKEAVSEYNGLNSAGKEKPAGALSTASASKFQLFPAGSRLAS